MDVIDSHHHFWDPALFTYPWMSGAPASLQHRFWVEDLRPLLADAGVSGTVFVQTHASLAETRMMLDLAASTDFLVGVVGWLDLTDPGVGVAYDSLRAEPHGQYLVGIRHQVEDEPDPRWLLRPEVQRGLGQLERAEAVYDLLVRPRDLPSATETVCRFPGMQFVVDHVAKPPIRTDDTGRWRDLLGRLAESPNVACKLSGLVTEADSVSWTATDLDPYAWFAIDVFGPDRLMFGSDWPVCTLGGSYREVLDATVGAIAGLDSAAQARILGGTAAEIYRLSSP